MIEIGKKFYTPQYIFAGFDANNKIIVKEIKIYWEICGVNKEISFNAICLNGENILKTFKYDEILEEYFVED